jgi:hypothetical protein
MRENRNSYRLLMRKSERKSQHGRPGFGWQCNVIYVEEIGWNGVD